MPTSTRDLQLIELKDQIRELLENQKQKDEQIAELLKQLKNQQEQIEYLTKKLFGSSSEKRSSEIDGQLSLFNEAEDTCDLTVPEIEEEPAAARKGKPKKSHKDQFSGVPVEEVLCELPEAELICPECGCPLEQIGKEFIREEFKFTPAKGCLIRYYAATYKCPDCTEGMTDDKGALFAKGPVPAPLLKNSFASAAVVAWTIYQKYVNAVPLYRQEKDWAMQGISLSRTTLANWIIRTTRKYLEPLYEHVHRSLVKRQFLMADETRVQVLNEEGRAAQTDSFIWLIRSGEDSLAPLVLYRYTQTRAKYNAVSLLKGFTGYLETDGYPGYNDLPGVTRCCCWSHVRRNFFDAIPKGSQLDMSQPPVQALQFIDKLFAVEKVSRQKGHDYKQRYEFRQKYAVPLLEAFWRWLDKQKPVKGSRMDKAVNYAQNRKPHLMTYLEDGRCSLSNNESENLIRPFALGRKNWLFSSTPEGAQASAMCYTLIELAKLNGVNPLKYMHFILTTRPTAEMCEDELEKFMPWHTEVIEACQKEIE